MNEINITAKSLKDLHKAALKLAQQINVPEKALPTFGKSIDFGYPNIEVNSRGLHYVVVERGKELDRKTTQDPNELMYWVFKSATFDVASKFELANKVEKQDSRRILFSKQEELLGMIDSSWKSRLEQSHAQILRNHPFDDYSSIRARYCAELRDSGVSDNKAWNKACEKYPLP